MTCIPSGIHSYGAVCQSDGRGSWSGSYTSRCTYHKWSATSPRFRVIFPLLFSVVVSPLRSSPYGSDARVRKASGMPRSSRGLDIGSGRFLESRTIQHSNSNTNIIQFKYKYNTNMMQYKSNTIIIQIQYNSNAIIIRIQYKSNTIIILCLWWLWGSRLLHGL